MTKKEWIDNGYKMGVIEEDNYCEDIFGDVYRAWFKMKNDKIKPESLDRIECTYKRYFANNPIVIEPIVKFNEHYIISWLTNTIRCTGKMTYKEFSRIYQVIYGVYMFAYDMEYEGLRLLDWQKIRRFMPDNLIENRKSDTTCIPRKDIDILFKSVLIDDVYPLKESACLRLLANFYLGLRVGELAALTWNDIDFKRRCINVNKTAVKYYNRDGDMERIEGMAYHIADSVKTLSSFRMIPMCDDVVYLLKRVKQHHEINNYDSPYICYDGTDTILIRSLDRCLRRLCKLCDIPVYNTHKIRKTCATYLHDSCVPLKTVSRLLGHSEISTTAKYYVGSLMDDKQAIHIINNAFKNMVEI